jgi:hypothetical protein
MPRAAEPGRKNGTEIRQKLPTPAIMPRFSDRGFLFK